MGHSRFPGISSQLVGVGLQSAGRRSTQNSDTTHAGDRNLSSGIDIESQLKRQRRILNRRLKQNSDVDQKLKEKRESYEEVHCQNEISMCGMGHNFDLQSEVQQQIIVEKSPRFRTLGPSDISLNVPPSHIGRKLGLERELCQRSSLKSKNTHEREPFGSNASEPVVMSSTDSAKDTIINTVSNAAGSKLHIVPIPCNTIKCDEGINNNIELKQDRLVMESTKTGKNEVTTVPSQRDATPVGSPKGQRDGDVTAALLLRGGAPVRSLDSPCENDVTSTPLERNGALGRSHKNRQGIGPDLEYQRELLKFQKEQTRDVEGRLQEQRKFYSGAKRG